MATDATEDAVLTKFGSEWSCLSQETMSSADYYFNSYAHWGIHEEMLKDQIRTGTYMKAILHNSHLFKNKIVLDVGSGTGILCLFAAKAGAAHVYGVECSDIVLMARKIAEANGYADRITYIQGKAEEVSLPVEKVDIIISEWMGYFLLYESMLDTVLFCRDKWLIPGGLIFPDRAALHVAAIEDGDYKQEKIGFWRDVYHFNFSCLKQSVMEEPIVDTVESQAVATDSCCILDLDLNTCTVDDLNFSRKFSIQLQRKDFLHALVAWFDVTFSTCHKPIHFTTSPHGRYTHWKQTVFYMEDVLVCEKGERVNGMVAVRKSEKNPRDLDIKIQYEFNGQISQHSRTQYYRLR
eukprot:GHVL01026161.1.p1 GENE.GHVL01026161.1~~GHVL01026161.1.p1  ORF type:complete len:351 (-),score=50.14 GHVL01026161.1:179-1231(-)